MAFVTDSDRTLPDDYQPHIGVTRQYMRDIILGVNDGLVSTFLLVSAVVGGGLTATQVLLTGVSGALAGMISMAIGEYLATKSQEEVFEAEMELEKQHLIHHRQHEKDQLSDMLGAMGLAGEDLDTVVEIIDSNETAMLNMQGALEFGIVEGERRSPMAAALTSGLLFLGGAVPSIIPFAISGWMGWTTTGPALVAAGILSGAGLFVVGALKTTATRKNPIFSGSENLAFGLVGGVIAYFVGVAFDSVITS